MRGLLGLLMVSVFGLSALVLRAIRHKRRTGSWGLVLPTPGSGGRERIAGALFALAVSAIVLGSVLALGGLVEPVVRSSLLVGVGCVLYVVGLVATVWAQEAMGRSWRMGVDPSERTELVTEGPFGSVRNPIYTGMLAAFLGVAAVAPNWVAIAGFVAFVGALELQTRWVEEPHLLRTHGEPYLAYADRTGRFVPGVGRGVKGPRPPSSRGSRRTAPPRRPRSS